MKQPYTDGRKYLLDLFAEHPELGIKTVARLAYGQRPELFKNLNAAYGSARRIVGSMTGKKPVPGFERAPGGNIPKEGFSFDEDKGGAAVAVSVSRDIRTLEDLLAFAKVDQDVWEVQRYVVNKWDMGYKDTDGEAQAKPLYQIKAWLQRRRIIERTKEIVNKLLEEFRKQAPTHTGKPVKRKGCLLELSIFDLHLGKLCWAPEVGSSYDVRIAESGFYEAIDALLERAKGFPIERILLPTGNDFFNVDGHANQTTAGTPQREDGRWQKSFIVGRKMLVDTILRLRKIAPVDVVMISGNHDTERVFYLGDTLAGWFHKTDGVTVDNSPTMRKYYRWGASLIGFTHGGEEKHKDLPLIMATEKPKEWAETKFRELHLGHWHHKSEIHWQPVQEFNGIRVRVIPSLCPADDWHRLKGYEGLRAAEAYVWDREQGCIGSFSYTPEVMANGDPVYKRYPK
jgi:hypothetical protein